VKEIQKDNKLNEDLQKLLKVMKHEFGVILRTDVIHPYKSTAECMELLKRL